MDRRYIIGVKSKTLGIYKYFKGKRIDGDPVWGTSMSSAKPCFMEDARELVKEFADRYDRPDCEIIPCLAHIEDTVDKLKEL